jgi:hypothetical protein
MACKIVYSPALPKEVKREVAEYLATYRVLFPGWLHLLQVSYKHEHPEESNKKGGVRGPGKKVIASMDTQPEYRQAALVIYSPWHTATEDFRELTVVHELVHIPLQSMVNFTWSLLSDAEDTLYQSALHEQYRSTFEGAVEDLSRAFQKTINGKI